MGRTAVGARFGQGLKMTRSRPRKQFLELHQALFGDQNFKKLPKVLDHPMSGRALVPSSISLILSVGRTVLASAKVTRSEEVVILMMHKTVCRRFGHSNQDRQMLVSQRKNFSAYLAVFIR